MNFDITTVTVQEMKDGFVYHEQSGVYKCLFCEAAFEQGMIYPLGERFSDARTAIRFHIKAEHDSVFQMLLSEGKRRTGLTDTQRELLLSFYSGQSDKEIAGETNTSASTVRYQRFSFREKAKQAKIILALSELLEAKLKQNDDAFPEIHEGATMIDERYMVTDAEAEKIRNSFFLSLTPPKLKNFSSKEKNKLVILKVIAKQFEAGKQYTEKEINAILQAIHDDYATIRRYLIEYGFMERTPDCSAYWLK